MKDKNDKRLATRAAKLRLEVSKIRKELNAVAREVRAASDKKLVQIIREEAKGTSAFGSDFREKITNILKSEAETIAEMRSKK